MDITYIIISFAVFFTQISVITVLYRQISGITIRWYSYLNIIIFNVTLCLIAPLIGYFFTYLFWLGYSLYKDRSHNRPLAVFYGLYPVVIESLFNRVMAFYIFPTIGISLEMMAQYPVLNLLIELLILPLSYGVTRSIQLDFRNLQVGVEKRYLNRTLIVVDVSMIVYCISLQLLLLKDDLIPNATAYREKLVGAYVIFFLIVLIYLNSKCSDRLQDEILQQKDIQLSELAKYSQHIEKLYEEIRSFRHDYINVLMSIQSGLELRDLDAIQKVYNTVLSKTVTQFSDQKYDIASLSKVSNTAVKSVLSAKLREAHEKGIKLEIEIEENLDLSIIDTLDIITILAILLDNAIEATLLTKQPILKFALFHHNGYLVCIVENSMFQESISQSEIFKKGYSTKGKSRGIGLNKVMNILDQYPNASIRTRSANHCSVK
ncbi:sensor histidine kinase [Ligilactobacillus apodemi]|uniref:Histidine kinase n=1 Tax=Ligilactobacillus apodemi DSM 16634 = JCM 16172 TaxID=1423724 RepID=A0A0R1TUE2_9LACO|nr:GHKL domain-containing protein [Ligilactobacillus apodemi]KRL84845.1 histidine kinase [Ligilactobacillus apodemi DSM 16634 = JCM 16172]